MWFVWALQAQGVGGFLKHLFGPKGETSGIIKLLMIVIFFAVGWLEVISILFRPGDRRGSAAHSGRALNIPGEWDRPARRSTR